MYMYGNGNFVTELNSLSMKSWRHIKEWKYNSTILDLNTFRGEWSASLPACFNPRYPLDRRLGRLKSRSGHTCLESKPDHPARRQWVTKLFRLAKLNTYAWKLLSSLLLSSSPLSLSTFLWRYSMVLFAQYFHLPRWKSSSLKPKYVSTAELTLFTYITMLVMLRSYLMIL
jgi:hypothetical protein